MSLVFLERSEVDLGATKLSVANLTPGCGNSTRINGHFQLTPLNSSSVSPHLEDK